LTCGHTVNAAHIWHNNRLLCSLLRRTAASPMQCNHCTTSVCLQVCARGHWRSCCYA
jgi:Fe-S-cluster-containing dehydrogenase component